ncbi:chymotrypsin-2 isoform X1 [Fopius arisanus]|uniref:Chymotrypsin-2 isoform X1 n=1 Tax=Fopius arisanus TaxID=64838 RepID=A0A9R1TJ81_9HYME|nr:PREDICTED: chymotrypsin-2-like isoform X1 [Fopius arisanus]XP_011310436.1 PREDICTED: chymotrypsin-2-like isoform X1 [Fopius arisanus]
MEFRGIQLIVFIAVSISCGYSTDLLRIINGKSAMLGRYPHQVSIQRMNWHTCGGSIIDEIHILTAAHCVVSNNYNVDLKGLRVVTGVIDRAQSNFTNTFRVSMVYYHRYFRPQPPANDIAILKLSRQIPFNDYQRPIKLPTQNTQSRVEVTVTGWGRGYHDNRRRKQMRYLQKLNMITVSLRVCQYIYGRVITPRQLCAKGAPGSGMCIGDSGGALTHNDEIVGIASWVEIGDGLPCAKASPDVFTRVYAYLPWINDVLSLSHQKSR